MNSRLKNGLKAESLYREMLEAGRSVKLQITVRIAREDSLVLRWCECYLGVNHNIFGRNRACSLASDPQHSILVGTTAEGLNSETGHRMWPGSSWFWRAGAIGGMRHARDGGTASPFGPLAKWARIGSKAVGLPDPYCGGPSLGSFL